jgi:SAM-dependent methyltransferase
MVLCEIKHAFRSRVASCYRRFKMPPPPNLCGDRDIEQSWIAAKMPKGPGRALDFGCGPFWMGFLAARKGFTVMAVDLMPVRWNYEHANLQFLQTDILNLAGSDDRYDLIINCSTIEHVGLQGRYGVRDQQDDADLAAMATLRDLVEPEGTMLLTLPVGRDAVFMPYHRVYGRSRLPQLLERWAVKEKEFWAKTGDNVWVRVDEAEALAQEASDHYYGLGLFVLEVS